MKIPNPETDNNFFSLNKYLKRSIAVSSDLVVCFFTVWFAYYLRLEEFILFKDINFSPVIISMIIAIPIFWVFGLYRTLIRYADLSILSTIAISTFVYGIIYFFIISIYVIQGVPRSVGIIQPILLFLGILGSRFLVKYFLTGNFNSLAGSKNKENILIYGAGDAGRRLLLSLENNPQYEVAGFLDDNPELHRQFLFGQKIYNPTELDILRLSKNIKLILFAIPSISKLKKNEIIKNFNKYKLVVKTLPNVSDIIGGKLSISDIRDFLVEDLLNRDPIEPDYSLLNKNIRLKTVLVTGAGGTIGSEISRQIIRLKPKKLILIELNEFALYKISEELKSINQNIEIISLLINVQNKSKIEQVFKTFSIDTVYHAAAYKHVSLVEENICESVKNNVFGTFVLAQAALKYNVSNFALISSDKAVRSTNIMGATKRLAEICIQSLYDNQDQQSKFAIVRFGNVLESSGSVIPKFKKQIKEGGPLTLTHPDVTRYFMTITEASQLVIQASAMAEKCEVFVLDMGKSVKIKDLIDKMVKLSGFSIKDSKNLDGDIEVKITGLKPGEKLYEELLIGDNPQETYHKKIQKAQDPFIPFNRLKIDLDNLSSLIEENRVKDVKDMLSKLILSYQSNAKIVDHFYEQQLNSKFNLKSFETINSKENKVVKIKTK